MNSNVINKSEFKYKYLDENEMKTLKHFVKLVMYLVVIPASCFARQEIADSNTFIVRLYPNLATGALTYAKVGSLPESVLLKAEEIQISSKDIDAFISGQPEQVREELKKNSFFVLEQQAANKLLLKMAKQELGRENTDISSMPDYQLIKGLFDRLTNGIAVSDQDVETFYKENESVFCNTPLGKVRKQIETFVLQEKKQRLVTEHLRTVGQRMEIVVSDTWVKQQAILAKDNPLDKIRGNGKPTLAVFSAASCCGPDKMLPVYNSIKSLYSEGVNIMYLEARKEQILAARYNVHSIPAQIFFDKAGNEVFRHTGFFSKEDILAKWKELGVDLTKPK